MKKFISIIMMLSITLSILMGCSSKGGTKITPSPQGDTPQTPINKQEPSKLTPGTELSDFLGNYSETKTKLWDQMTKNLDTENNLNFTIGIAGFAFADLAIVDILLFDTLTIKDGDTFKGKLMLSGIDGWKKVNGDIIEFGYDMIYEEQNGNFQKGDHTIAKGKLEKNKNSLVYEYSTERGGKVISRYIVEVTRNSDSSYTSQTYYLDLSGASDKNTLSGYLTWFDDKNIISYLAEKDVSDINFTYNSIFGKKNIKPDEMANGMTITTKISYIDGKALYEDLSNK